ncbi:MAG: hypothetical protein IT380_14360 [Myxococcales bacterium]|nr:hypothetical protein [Myxococcales bacterium]
MNHETNWLPGLLVLAAGAVVALLYLFGSKRAGSEAAPQGPVDNLDAKYQRLLAELKEHQANKHLFAADVWAREQERLEQAAAAALKEREGVKHEVAKQHARLEKKEKAQAQDKGFFAQHPALGGALFGGVIVAFFVYLGVSVSDSSTQRQEGMSATGAQGPAQALQPPPEDPKLQALAARVQSNPEDLDALTGLALHLIMREGFTEARPLLARAALLDPYHVKGRVGRAVMKAVDGDVPGAQAELEKLAARYPEAFDGHLYAGLLAIDQNDPRRAVQQLEAYVNTAPPSEQPPMIRMEVERLKADLAGGAPMPR